MLSDDRSHSILGTKTVASSGLIVYRNNVGQETSAPGLGTDLYSLTIFARIIFVSIMAMC